MAIYKGFMMSMAALLIVPACSHKQTRIKRTVTVKTTPKTTGKPLTATHPDRITIWVHGTKFLLPIDTWVHACPAGMHAINKLPKKYLLRGLTTKLSHTAPDRFPLETFYAFGWSGDLSFKAREHEAHNLHKAITALVNEFQTQYQHMPRITIITHSHGGNVALNLAKIKEQEANWTIDELILLAAPVQDETKNLIKEPLFKKIYSLYSSLDSIQILDPQGIYKHAKKKNPKTPTFSQRRFLAHANLRQAQLKIHGLGILHIGFITRGFIAQLPGILDAIDAWEDDAPGATSGDCPALLSVI